MVKTLHEQQGLRIVANEHNGFTVCTLHYTADPKKRSPEWREAAKRGMPQARYEQEFEIIYDSYMGQKVFPEMKSRRQEIVVKEGPYEFNKWPKTLPMWGGFDYGANNPSSFHVYTIVDGILYALWELYEPCRNILDFAAAMKACPFMGQIRYIAHDPDMCNLKQRDINSGASTSVRQQFERLGITRWLPGNTDEQAWLVKMQQHWLGEEVTFKVLECCPNLIDELESITYVSMTERQLQTANYKEGIVDKHNHALDDLKYLINSCPSENQRPVRVQSMLDSYSWGRQGAVTSRRGGELGLLY